jgi:hypothetical protein
MLGTQQLSETQGRLFCGDGITAYLGPIDRQQVDAVRPFRVLPVGIGERSAAEWYRGSRAMHSPVTLPRIENWALSHPGLIAADFPGWPRLTWNGGLALDSCAGLRKVHFGAGLKVCGGVCAFCNRLCLTALVFQPCPILAKV